jgi:antitoxin (DNA-binding transcriptional repressor) of toxin-antitoxin stability system
MVNRAASFIDMSRQETITISQFKATCLAILARVKRTRQPILVTRKGEVIAQILPPPLPEKPQSWLGSFRSTGKIVGDIISPAIEPQEWEILQS